MIHDELHVQAICALCLLQIIYDPDPNPKNEEQAIARSHRIGQTREVQHCCQTENAVQMLLSCRAPPAWISLCCHCCAL